MHVLTLGFITDGYPTHGLVTFSYFYLGELTRSLPGHPTQKELLGFPKIEPGGGQLPPPTQQPPHTRVGGLGAILPNYLCLG